MTNTNVVIDLSQFKQKKEMKTKALQYAKAYGVDINTVLTTMQEVADSETTVTTIITEQEAMEALGDNYLTPEQLVKYGLMEEQFTDVLNESLKDKLDDDDYLVVDIGLEEYAKQKDIKIIPINPDIPY